MVKFKWMLTSLALAGALSACGGGSESNGSGQDGTLGVASTNAFNLQSGYQAMVRQGYTKTFNLSGSCTGSLTSSSTAASFSTTFEGAPAFSSNQTRTNNFVGSCTLPSSPTVLVQYYNPSYSPIGFSNPAGGYGVAVGVPSLPATVHVGDTGMFANINLYADNTRLVVVGHQSTWYAVVADTASTALVNFISMQKDANDVLVSTEVNSFRMDASGNLTPFGLMLQIGNAQVVGI